MTKHVVVIDYGIGNIHSVVKALRHEGAEVEVSSDPTTIEKADRLVLPGVGAFADGMHELEKRSLVAPIATYFASKRPFLGICLGMQLMLGESEEFGQCMGLGHIPGKVVRIPADQGVKVPHTGWNTLVPATRAWEDSPLAGLESESPSVYFVHSFMAAPADAAHRLADTLYGGVRVCAAVARDNFFGFQFHPEKSGPLGLGIVRRFLDR